MRYLASALAEGMTHDGISTFEMGLDLTTMGNKGNRSNQVVTFMFKQPDTDALVLSLLNYLYVENTYSNQAMTGEAFKLLESNVLKRRRIGLKDNGYTLPDGRDVDSLERVDRAPQAATSEAATVQTNLFDGFFTNNVSFEQTSQTLGAPSEPATIQREANKVFVVHGRDMRRVTVIRQYLLHLGLYMMTWSEAVDLTGESQPHTYDVVRAGIAGSAAVLVIFSPDDLARIKDEYSEPSDPDRVPHGQPRQNVLLEAGMAFAMSQQRTIFIKSAPTRDISDIAGFNWVKLNGEYDSRRDLKLRLTRAGAAVRPGDYDLSDPLSGSFRVIS